MVLNFRTIANNFQEADDDVDYDTDSRNAKSRYVLKELEEEIGRASCTERV